MDTAKTIVVVIVALALGTAAGALATRRRYEEPLATLKNDLSRLREAAAAHQRAAETCAAQVERLETANKVLEEDLAVLKTEVDRDSTGIEDLFALDAPPAPANDSAAADETEPQAAGPWPGGRGGPRSRSEREAQRRAMGERFRERQQEMMNAQIDRETDPEARERLAAIQEYSNYTMELFEELRSAETEEARETLRAELQEAWQTSRSLMTEQQDHMLRQLAESHGIRAAADQDAFVASLRDTLTNPLFRGMGMGFGGQRGRGAPGMPFRQPGGRQNAPQTPSVPSF